MNTQEGLTWSPEEAAKRLGISVATVYVMCQRREVPAVKLGRRWLISARGLDEWVESHTGMEVRGR